MVTYDLPANITGFVDFTQYTNTVTEGWFGSLILLAIALVMFLAFKKFEDTRTTFMAVGLIMLLFGIMFWILELIPPIVFIMCIALAVVGVLAKVTQSEG